ncbi:TPA: DUF2829 domain-containing protein [Pasteurella multocida]|nr:DUF2829 domain-containing protein [Pasteurella multocida]HDR1861947.1 DUF2829 domain-containing protein [Pasteurella multocida]
MGISFGTAVQALKDGKKVCRSGWNGKGMYLFLVCGETVRYHINHQHLHTQPDDAGMQCLDAIYMKTADNKLVPWLASQTDVLATDWELVK